MDPHAVLGIGDSASPAEIDAAYARRRRVHDPGSQTDASARAAALRYRADLAAAYRELLGTDPPADAPPGSEVPVTGPPRPATASSAGRDWLLVLMALVTAYVVIQLPVAFGFGLAGIAVGWLGALGVVGFTLVRIRGRRT